MIRSFLLGLIVGGGAVYFYGRQIGEFVDSQTRGARDKAADTLQSAAETLHAARETIEGGLSGKERRAG